jgi:type II secretory pathway component HofQ
VRTLLVLAVLAQAVSAHAGEEKEKTVVLDVKDAEARAILRSMQKQCGVKNMIIDPDVGGTGTFYFRDVPCETAFKVVFRTLGLAGQVMENSVVTVRMPKG